MSIGPPKCDELDYIHFLIAAQRVFTCTEAARCQAKDAPACDAFTRLPQRQPFNAEALWQQAKALVDRKKGLLVLLHLGQTLRQEDGFGDLCFFACKLSY